MKIKIISGSITAEAELYDNNTTKRILEILPIETSVQTWGDEIYFEVSTHVDADETAKEVVELGDLGFWPEGDCFCIFFGKTPASKGDEIRPASKVNVFGKVLGDPKIFKEVKQGDTIRIEK